MLIESLRRAIKREIASISEALSSGAPKDWSEYKYLTGKVDGLLLADSILRSGEKLVESDPSDEEP